MCLSPRSETLVARRPLVTRRPRSASLKPVSESRDPRSVNRFRDTRSKIRNSRSEGYDPRSEIQSLRSVIRSPCICCFVFVALFCLVPEFLVCACPVTDSRPLATAQRRQLCMEWFPLVGRCGVAPLSFPGGCSSFVWPFVVCSWCSVLVGQSEELS